MTTVKNKAMLFGMLMLLSVFALSGSTALAAKNMNSSHDTKDVCADEEDMDDAQDENDNESNDAEDICEKAESAKLASQVDISEAKARQIANDGYTGNGKITELLLANDEDDNNVSRVVYEIEFTEIDGTQVDVKVDANTGKYLGVDMEDDEDNDESTVKGGKSSDLSSLQKQLVSLLQQLIALLRAQ